MDGLEYWLKDLRADGVADLDCLYLLDRINRKLEVDASSLRDHSKVCIDCTEFIFRNCKPPLCPSCNSSQNCKFVCLNNKKVARSIQPRFLCDKCRKHFTAGSTINGKKKAMPITAERENTQQKACSCQRISSCSPHISEEPVSREQDPHGIGCPDIANGTQISDDLIICESMLNNIVVAASTIQCIQPEAEAEAVAEPNERLLDNNVTLGLHQTGSTEGLVEEKYKNEGHDTIVLVGAEYGSGSSCDFAAKGPMLLEC